MLSPHACSHARGVPCREWDAPRRALYERYQDETAMWIPLPLPLPLPVPGRAKLGAKSD